MKRFIILLLSMFILTATLAGLTSCKDEEEEQGLIIAVTIMPEKAFAEAVCGDLATVVVAVPQGFSPETYEPDPMEIEQLSKASVYFSMGLPEEEDTILNKLDDIEIVMLDEAVRNVYADIEFEPGSRDPHIWLSPRRVVVMVQAIADKMALIDPANAATYLNNATDYIFELNGLDSDVATLFNGKENKSFITYHPAYGYLAEDYGLTMYSLEEEGKEATAQHIQDIIDIALLQGISVIFTNAETDGTQAEAFAEEISGSKVTLAPLSYDYISNYRAMAQAIADAL
jgi:zinc transport system substrate-binding protein